MDCTTDRHPQAVSPWYAIGRAVQRQRLATKLPRLETHKAVVVERSRTLTIQNGSLPHGCGRTKVEPNSARLVILCVPWSLVDASVCQTQQQASELNALGGRPLIEACLDFHRTVCSCLQI